MNLPSNFRVTESHNSLCSSTYIGSTVATSGRFEDLNKIRNTAMKFCSIQNYLAGNEKFERSVKVVITYHEKQPRSAFKVKLAFTVPRGGKGSNICGTFNVFCC